MLDKLSLRRIFLGVLMGLFLVFVLTLATQAKERLVDVSTLMVEKLPPSDVFVNWQAVSCGSMAEGDCDDDDLIGTSSFIAALDDDGNCHAKKYEVWVADNFQMTGTITKFRVNDLNAILSGLLVDGKNHGIWIFAICHGHGD
jgi:hypothetical protein